jgi:hypothetical protein
MPGIELDRQILLHPIEEMEDTAEQVMIPDPEGPHPVEETENAAEQVSTSEPGRPLSGWLQQMVEVQNRLIRVAQFRTDMHTATHVPAADPDDDEIPLTAYLPNTFVLVAYPDGLTKGRPPNKFNTQLKGPHRVLRNIGPQYEILNLVTNKTENVHVSRLRPYHQTERSPTPLSVAAKDNQEYIVESIHAHAGDPRRYGSMDFLVRWAGYGPEDDMYIPWAELRNNPVLHEYLFRVGLINTIPKEHRAPYKARA